MIVTNSLTGGGAERSMNLVCNELTKRGWSVSLMPINSGPPDLIVPTCEVFPLDRKWKDGIKKTMLALKDMNLIVKSWRPDIIILNCDLPELFGVFLLGKHHLVAIEHTTNPWAQRLILGRIVRRILTFRMVTWVAVSTHLTIWPSGSKPSEVLQNPVTPSREINSHTTNGSINRLVYLGRLSSEKRPELALEIALSTCLKIVVIGEGVMRNKLEHQAMRESIKANFLGRVDNPWLEVQAGDLLIVPSAFEGDGLVVLEGLQHNIPMLLADIPDFRRFRLPDKNYCANLSDFVTRIGDFKDRPEELRVPIALTKSLLVERNLEVIGSAWEAFLEQIE